VRAVDGAGNRDATPATFTWTIRGGVNPQVAPQRENLGAYRVADGAWSLDSNGAFGFQAEAPPGGDRVIADFRQPGGPVVPVAGNFANDPRGTAQIGEFVDGVWHLDLNDNGRLDPGETFRFGQAGDVPVAGNYFGDGMRLAVFRADADGISGRFVIAGTAWRTELQITVGASFLFGRAGDRVVTGDWDGSGVTKVGVFRSAADYGAPAAAVFSLDADGDGIFTDRDRVFIFGRIDDGIVIGDWDGGGVSKVGVYRDAAEQGASGTAVFSLDQDGDGGFRAGVDEVFLYGRIDDRFVTGRWAREAGEPLLEGPPLEARIGAEIVTESA
jgi:hypothetical protein